MNNEHRSNTSSPSFDASPMTWVDYLIVKSDNKLGIIDSLGNEICKPNYDYIYKFDNSGLARVEQRKKIGLIDKKGNVVLAPSFDEIWYFADDGLTTYAKNNNLYCHITNKGKILYEPKYESVGFLEGTTKKIAYAKYNNKYGLIDSLGNHLLPFEYNDIQFEELNSKGIPVFLCDGKYFIDGQFFNNYEKTHPSEYLVIERDEVTSTKPEISNVKISGSKDSIHISVIKSFSIKNYSFKNIYDSISYIKPIFYKQTENELLNFLVSKNHEFGIIDINGKIVIPLVYRNIYIINRNILLLEGKQGNGLYNLILNKRICSDDYSSFSFDERSAFIFATRNDGIKGYIDYNCESYFPKFDKKKP